MQASARPETHEAPGGRDEGEEAGSEGPHPGPPLGITRDLEADAEGEAQEKDAEAERHSAGDAVHHLVAVDVHRPLARHWPPGYH
jgi:hypothetical protein